MPHCSTASGKVSDGKKAFGWYEKEDAVRYRYAPVPNWNADASMPMPKYGSKLLNQYKFQIVENGKKTWEWRQISCYFVALKVDAVTAVLAVLNYRSKYIYNYYHFPLNFSLIFLPLFVSLFGKYPIKIPVLFFPSTTSENVISTDAQVFLQLQVTT